MVEISASLLSVGELDSTKLFLDLETAKIDYFHIDVMDGKFVKQDTTLRMMEYTNTISLVSSLGLDVHLMVEDPDEYIEKYIPFHPRFITFHIEAADLDNKDSRNYIEKLINKIKESGSMVGIAINPDTNIKAVEPYLNMVHMILVMTVVPGKGGQKLIPDTLTKVKRLKEYITNNSIDINIEVDGGINDITSKDAIKNGANILVVGSYLIAANDYKKTVNEIRTNEKEGYKK